ncbi:Inactive tyrosine-protein kinase transmembrane receptor ROR1 [Geodia barretti]|uniref:Inactive tyrosine-protein kinase transmembrane receptor ROR1 n=1 Tax=Geodia barretti TaxID=519541 RepID=A0AA35VZ27_GEOBA|nr:Inactive tyrosine-protein kinase transmembrane receptor ROR1 [Geodia barretti]
MTALSYRSRVPARLAVPPPTLVRVNQQILTPPLQNCSNMLGSARLRPLSMQTHLLITRTTLIIIVICLCLGIPILLCAVLLVATTLCYCRSSEPPRGDDVQDGGGNLEYIQPGYPNPIPQDYHKNTLLMRPGNIRDAFLGLDNSAPTGTFARNLRSKEYLKMTPKQRLQALEFPHSNICITKDSRRASLRNDTIKHVQQQFTADDDVGLGLHHPNILSLLAVCNREEPRYMIFEHLEFGTLRHFLRSLDSAWMDFDQILNEEASTAASTASPALGVDDMIGLGMQVADGMEYLSSKGLVHKDLAARNCHVSWSTFECQDRQLWSQLPPPLKDYCIISSCSKISPVPLRWLAPESLEHGKFSPHSDSWSFGILLWEIFTFGEHPYSDCSNAQVVKNIVRRSLLEVPENVPRVVHDLIHKCWNKTPVKRPLFTAISRALENALGGLNAIDLKRFGQFPSTTDVNNKTM